ADVACDGREVLAALKEKRYDLILMDVQMPEMDGLEATRQIRQQWPDDERPRIVALTAHAMKEDHEACRAAGMDEYLTKPIQIKEIRAVLERVGQWVMERGAGSGKRPELSQL